MPSWIASTPANSAPTLLAGSVHILRFLVADAHYAVGVARVVEVAPRVLVTPLPDTPRFIEGVFSYRRSTCVAVSVRQRLGYPARAAALDEHIIVVRGRRRLLGLIVDRALHDEHLAAATLESPAVPSRLVAGLVPLEDGVLLVQDVDALLTDDEERAIEASLQG